MPRGTGDRGMPLGWGSESGSSPRHLWPIGGSVCSTMGVGVGVLAAVCFPECPRSTSLGSWSMQETSRVAVGEQTTYLNAGACALLAKAAGQSPAAGWDM